MEMEAFAKKFEELINKYKKEIISGRSEDSIESCKNIRGNNESILRQLLIVKVTKGFWRENSTKFKKAVKEGGVWRAEYFQSEKGKKILTGALKYYHDADGEYRNLNEFLFKKLENDNMKKWIGMALKDEAIRKNVLNGDKSWKIFLRDAYDFKYIPIDMHEKRFQIRTGIFHHYLGKEVHNPDKNEHYEIALKKFAEEFLSDINIVGYNLGENPGLVDKFIWLHCAANKKNGGKGICAQEPKCKSCDLRGVCALDKN